MVKEKIRKPSEIHRRNISYNPCTFLVSLCLSPGAFLEDGEKSKDWMKKITDFISWMWISLNLKPKQASTLYVDFLLSWVLLCNSCWKMFQSVFKITFLHWEKNWCNWLITNGRFLISLISWPESSDLLLILCEKITSIALALQCREIEDYNCWSKHYLWTLFLSTYWKITVFGFGNVFEGIFDDSTLFKLKRSICVHVHAVFL